MDFSLVDRPGLRRTGSQATGDLSGRRAALSTVGIDSLAIGPIRFTNIGDLPRPDGAEILPLNSTRGLPSIDMLVGTSRVNALIDTGNLVPGFLLPGSLAPALTFVSSPVPYGTMRTVAGETAIRQARLKQAIQFGSHRFAEPMAVFPSISNNASIGSDVMSQFTITLDQRNHRVRFGKGVDSTRR